MRASAHRNRMRAVIAPNRRPSKPTCLPPALSHRPGLYPHRTTRARRTLGRYLAKGRSGIRGRPRYSACRRFRPRCSIQAPRALLQAATDRWRLAVRVGATARSVPPEPAAERRNPRRTHPASPRRLPARPVHPCSRGYQAAGYRKSSPRNVGQRSLPGSSPAHLGQRRYRHRPPQRRHRTPTTATRAPSTVVRARNARATPRRCGAWAPGRRPPQCAPHPHPRR